MICILVSKETERLFVVTVTLTTMDYVVIVIKFRPTVVVVDW